MRFLLCAILLALCGLALCQVRVPQATIIVDPHATAPEKLAARELADWLGKIVGRPIPVRESVLVAGNTILVGQGELARREFPDIHFASLGDEEVRIKSKGNLLLVAGGRPRGTVYAVNRLLHRQGVRWWTPWATHVPSKPNLVMDKLDIKEKPAFESRSPFWYHAFDRDWARRNNSNAHHARLTEEDGGRIEYEEFVHTFYSLVPPAKHFNEHPEWYSLIDGKRKVEGGQLCTTNSELRDFIVQQVKARLKAKPQSRIVSVSQNDWYGACQCPNCKAVDDAEGSPAGTMIALANYVAEKIEAEHPNVAIDTLAYQYTRKAPKTIKPRHNVIVRLCSIECSFSQPLEHPSNAAFAQDIRDWSKLTNRLYVWNYVTDFPHYMLPFPNWNVIGANQRFFAENGVKGLFEQGAYQSHGSAMAELHAWVQAQLLWDPQQDDRKLMHEFLHGYYGVAAQPIQGYMDALAKAAKDTPMNVWVGPDAPFFTYETVMEAERWWQRALDFAQRNVRSGGRDADEILWRVRLAHLPVRYVILNRWRGLRSEATKRGDKWPLPESRKAVADEWMKVAAGPGPAGWTPITHMNESGLTPQAWAARFAVDPVPVVLPNRPSVAALPPELTGRKVIDLQDEEAKLYGEGDMAELRPDKAASDGIAAWMPGTHHEWAYQQPLAKAPKETLSGKWRVLAVVRVDASGNDLPAFSAGIYDSGTSRALSSIQISSAQAGSTYRTYDLGVHALSAGAYVWVAPSGGGRVKAVWVDRILLVKE